VLLSNYLLIEQVTEFVVKTGSHSHVDLCSDKIESGVFLESLITVAAAIPSNVFAVLGMDTLGRKFFLGKCIFNRYLWLQKNII